MKNRLTRYFQLLKQGDRGTVSVTFIYCLPIFLTVVGVVTQYALMVNARITLDRALAATARSAMTALPADAEIEQMDGVDYMNKSARMILASISPQARSGPTSEGTDIYNALATLQTDIPESFPTRYAYAQDATTVSFELVDPVNYQGVYTTTPPPEYYSERAGVRIKLTVTYKFRFTVPAIKLLGNRETVGGIDGYYSTLTNSCYVTLSPGRKAASGSRGWPD